MERNNLIKKGVVVAVILLFVSVSVIPTTGTNIVEKSSTMSFDGNILYVGGSGPGNYTKIQDAIDNANDGDTVFVFDDSSPYLEPLLINNSITLIGEDKYSTIIDGNQGGAYGCNIEITAHSVVISDFTFKNTKGYYKFSIIRIYSNENQIINNIFYPTQYCWGINIVNGDRNLIAENIFYGIYNDGIVLEHSNNTNITENRFEGDNSGIAIYDSNNNNVSSNKLLGTYFIGIFLRGKNNTVSENSIWHAEDSALAAGIKVVGDFVFGINTIFKNRIEYCENGILVVGFSSYIKENTISNCKRGIWLWGGEVNFIANRIIRNHIKQNGVGIITYGPSFNIIRNNNIIQNSIDATFQTYIFRLYNLWIGNYWGRPYLAPKPIVGLREIPKPDPYEEPIILPCVAFDIRPALKPYDIEL